MHGKVVAIAVAVVIVAGLVYYFGFYTADGTLNVMVKDPMPQGWSQLYVNISSISIHNSTGQGKSGYSAVFSRPIMVNLANTTNTSAFLTSLKLPPGHYQMVRLAVASAYGVYLGKTYTVTVINGSTDIAGQFTIHSMTATTITLDFNSAMAIHGNTAAGFTMTPVVSLIVS
ncbi:MAG: DUF4382 domain-containing protein [Methanomassiliicoccales archaeon]